MLKVTNEMDLHDFMNEYEYILPEDYDACEIIFSSLEDLFFEGVDDMTIRDYIRFELCISTQSELLNDYNIIDEDEIKELDEDELHEKIEDYLSDHTYYLGYYEVAEGDNVYLYDEF